MDGQGSNRLSQNIDPIVKRFEVVIDKLLSIGVNPELTHQEVDSLVCPLVRNSLGAIAQR